MKFYVMFSALVALTVGTSLHKPAHSPEAELQEIIAAIHSPSTDPATALLLMQMLAELTGSHQPDISPVLVADEAEPPFAGHEIVEIPASVAASPLVQIIINVKQPNTAAEPAPVPAPSPVGDEVNVVDTAEEDESTGVEVVDLPLPPVTDVVVADNLPAPPVSGVIIADLPVPPSTGVEIADVPAPPSTGVEIADVPVPPSVVAVADVPKFPF